MGVTRIPLVGQNYTARSLAAAAQTSINVYPERIEDPNEPEKGGAMLIGCPGKHLFKDLTTIDATATPLRGVWSGGGRVFVAAGPKYFEISSTGALVGSVRTIADDATHSPVNFFANGNQLFIVSAGFVYCDNGAGPIQIQLPGLTGKATALGFFVDRVFDPTLPNGGDTFDVGLVGKDITVAATTRTVKEVLSPFTLTVLTSFGGAPITGTYTTQPPNFTGSSGAFGDGYFIASRSLTRQFNISPLLNGLGEDGDGVWNSFDAGVKESYPDYIRSILWHDEQLYLFGTESFEVWQNVGSQLVNGVASFPFRRIDGATAKYGSVSPNGPIAIGRQVFFLGGDSTGQVAAYVLDGFTPKRVSTFAEESQWGSALLGETAVSSSYLEEGHEFWVIDFGSGALTWVYDVTIGAWHQRARYTAGAFGPYGRAFHTFVTNSASSANDWGAGGKHLVGGDGSGKVYEQSLAFFDDVGTDMKWERSLPYLYNHGKRLFFGRMELEMDTGTVASGAAPTISRDYSDDRGHTYSNPVPASLGTHDQFSIRVVWPSNGSGTRRQFRLSGVGQSKVGLVCLDLDLIEGSI